MSARSRIRPRGSSVNSKIPPYMQQLAQGFAPMCIEWRSSKLIVISAMAFPKDATRCEEALSRSQHVAPALCSARWECRCRSSCKDCSHWKATYLLIQVLPPGMTRRFQAVQDEATDIVGTDDLVARYCRYGANVWYQRNTKGDDTSELMNGSPRARKFLQQVLDDAYSHESCTVEEVAVDLVGDAAHSLVVSSSLRHEQLILSGTK